jgi:anti-sigma factor RsiW
MINSDHLLVAYVDGELDPAVAREVEAFLATDLQAVQKVAMFRETAALLREACDDRFFANDAPVPILQQRRTLRMPRHGWAIAASLVAAIVGFGGGVTWGGRVPSERAELIAEVASDHQIYSRETKHLVEVPADQVEHLKAWLGQRLDHKLEVPDLATAGLRFAGGRMLVVNDRPVAELMYTRENGLPIGIYVTQMAGDTAPISIDQRGLARLASWIAGGYAYVVAGEIDAPTAEDIARRVAGQTNG